MQKAFMQLLGTLVCFSCAHHKSEFASAPAAETVKRAKLVDTANLPNCKDCIVGSSSAKTLKTSTQKESYYLYGAEHLNLKNYYFDIPVVYNKKVQKWINYFLTRGKDYFVRYSARAGRYAPLMSEILNKQGLPRDLIYLAMAESGFQNHAKSWAKAVGPWQFMPYTGKRYGLQINWYVDERRDPIKATIAASKYLKDLYQMFESWELAAAGYNAGEGKIGRAIKRYKTENFWKISKGRYLKRETKNYVPKIMALAIIGKNLSSFGFKDIDFHKPLDFQEVLINPNTDLYKVADVLDMELEELKRWNPELIRWTTPNNGEMYHLRVPVGKKIAWDQRDQSINYIASDYQTYQVKWGASLKAVAKKYRLPVSILNELNPRLSRKYVSRNTSVKLPFRVGQSRKHNMYADLYELPSKRVRRKRAFNRRVRLAKRRGKLIKNPTEFYTVKKGDSLWSVSRKTGVSLDTLIKTNLSVVRAGSIFPGQKLAIR